MTNLYSVYVKTDAYGNIVEVNSSAFLSDTTGWTKIDEGEGDKYHHAQNHYLTEPIADAYGRTNFILIGGKVVENLNKPPILLPKTIEERLTEVEQKFTTIDSTVKTFTAVKEVSL